MDELMAQAVHDDDMGMFIAIQRECPGDIGRLTLLADRKSVV